MLKLIQLMVYRDTFTGGFKVQGFALSNSTTSCSLVVHRDFGKGYSRTCILIACKLRAPGLAQEIAQPF